MAKPGGIIQRILIGLALLPLLAHAQAVDTLTYRLSGQEEGFMLFYSEQPLLPVPESWLMQTKDVEEELDNSLSSFNYDEHITAFPIGNSLIGLHLSSYELQQEGSAGAAAGRDVFLVLNPEKREISQGHLRLGITKSRGRYVGCRMATFHHFFIGDINHDQLMDIGVVKEEVACEVDGETLHPRARIYKRHLLQWYVFNQERWMYASEYDSKLPWSFARRLPLIGIVKTPVDYVTGN